jgi:HlyD family secretion protein
MKTRTKILAIITSIGLLASCTQPTQEAKPIKKDVTETVFAAGTLEANNTYSLTAQSDGYLVTVNFKEGDIVQKGKVLAIIENQESGLNVQNTELLYQMAIRNTNSNAPALQQAQINIATAEQKLQQDKLTMDRYTRLVESNSIPKVDYENAAFAYNNSKNAYENAVQNLKKLQQDTKDQTETNQIQKQISRVALGKNQISAVVNGKVYQKLKQTGDFVKRGEVIATIGDANFIYAQVNVDEGSIAKVKIGQEALIQLNTNKSKSYKASVAEILPSFDAQQQSFVVKLKFTEPLDFTIVKTQLQTNIEVGVQKNAILIPRNYLDAGGFVQIKDKKEKTKVKVNFVSNEWVHITEGLSGNETLVTTNIKQK